MVGIVAGAAVFAAFLIIIGSLAFWLGNTSQLSMLALNAMLTFAIYPITLIDNFAKLVLFTLIPAALMGAVPADFVSKFSWNVLAQLALGAFGLLFLSVGVFRWGLRRYESGSGIQVEV